MIKIGEINFDGGYIGSSRIDKIYLGATLIYEDEPVPVITTTFLYTTTDGEVIDINTDKWEASIISNTYSGGQGTLVFEGELSSTPSSGFTECTNLRTITAPEGLQQFGSAAFMNLTNLEEVHLPSSYNRFQSHTFRGCTSLWYVNTWDIEEYSTSVPNYGGFVFQGTAISAHTIPEGVEGVGGSCFSGCTNLQSLVIPSTMEAFTGSSICAGCSNLTSITCNAVTAPALGTNPFRNITGVGELHYPEGSDYSSWYAVLPEGWRERPSSIDILYSTNNGQPIRLSATGWTEDMIISNTYDETTGQGILSLNPLFDGELPQRAFYNCTNLTSIEFPTNVAFTLPSNSATFFKCSNLIGADLSHFSISGSLTNVFRDCTHLQWAKIPYMVRNLVNSTFQNCDNIADIYMYAANGGTFATPSGTYSSSCVIHVPRNATNYDRWALPAGWSIVQDL